VSDVALVIGRLLFGALFLYNGINHFRNMAALTAYARYKHIPSAPAAVVISGIWLIVSALSIMLAV
jgi:putative oxidoreductase